MPACDPTTLADDELTAHSIDVATESARRAQEAAIPAQIDELNRSYLDLTGVVEGEEWVQPTGAHDAYPIDWVVTHEGKTWRSLVAGNVWEPPTNWREDSGEEWPAWVQPVGSEDAYPLGAKVSHTGRHWVSAVDANVWEPGAVGSEALWTEAG